MHFLTNVAENVGEDSRFIHQGVTSSDILDICLSLQFKQSCKILKNELKKLMDVLKQKAILYKNTPCIGRSHGIYAELTTFGLKIGLKVFLNLNDHTKDSMKQKRIFRYVLFQAL